ncbi:Hpt domain-containing protein [Acidicapsa ligni]|uniref:Hpt domain-containing protein n=1 Tax=Acidicapsa ligni TaxID=542300 RepID=UPI0021DF6F8C|nr:Hpt domain-containing protein [Acidicapsa ligni]
MATTPPPMADVLARMWTKFLPDIEARVATLEAAARALDAGSLPEDARDAAHAAAHKLAGTLGMFGLPRGTELARRAELLLVEDVSAADADELTGWVTEIRDLIHSRG